MSFAEFVDTFTDCLWTRFACWS